MAASRPPGPGVPLLQNQHGALQDGAGASKPGARPMQRFSKERASGESEGVLDAFEKRAWFRMSLPGSPQPLVSAKSHSRQVADSEMK